MSFNVSGAVIQNTKHKKFEEYRAHVKRSIADQIEGNSRYNRDWSLEDSEYDLKDRNLSDEELKDLWQAAEKAEDQKIARAVDAMLSARGGKLNVKVPNFKAFKDMLESFLKRDKIDGWIYVQRRDGKFYPELVTNVIISSGRNDDDPHVEIKTKFFGISTNDGYKSNFGTNSGRHLFRPKDCAKRSMADILLADDIYKETAALKAEYENSIKRFDVEIKPMFSHQFRFSGEPVHYNERSSENGYGNAKLDAKNRKVIHDVAPNEWGALPLFSESELFETSKQTEFPVPRHPVVEVFDLRSHNFYYVHSDSLTQHVYDKSLRDKLVLPSSHRDLLEVLTHDLDVFTKDIIEGKAAGNVVMCKGIPGVGKTLTAEVYAELIEKPLYSVHSGTLGTTSSSIEESLKNIFMLAKRWGCVLLMDEADVFVMQRGQNIEQNAIVAEFLRVLEYFDGLLFMTTNRPNDIDEAIISRCAAIINYEPPEPDHAAAIWRVMATQFEVTLSDKLIADLLKLFPEIAPRDIKMLLRLTLKVSRSMKKELNLDLFRRCAMFRAVKMSDQKEK